jgi:hypothetical protein
VVVLRREGQEKKQQEVNQGLMVWGQVCWLLERDAADVFLVRFRRWR